ncbi:MAG: hypothetical protein MR711_00395, partial [Selenomonas sp.]|uniref:hypothetical protein n=1 Tax=Selenomonas sp. TaxID=2053611 RepID=UPI0025D92D6C
SLICVKIVLIHSDTPLLMIVLQNHFNIGSRYGFLFLINCSTSFYNEPFFPIDYDKRERWLFQVAGCFLMILESGIFVDFDVCVRYTGMRRARDLEESS